MANERNFTSSNGHADTAVTFVNNELMRAIVTATSATGASTEFIRGERDKLTELVQTALATGGLDQFVLEFHEAGRGSQQTVRFDVTYGGNRTMEDLSVPALTEALPSMESGGVIALAYPIIDGFDTNGLNPIEDVRRQVGSFGARKITVSVGVR